MNLTDIKNKALIELCDLHRVKEIYLFGSILTDKFNYKSDIDMLVQFYPMEVSEYLDNYMDLKKKLEELFQRQIDLIENQAIKNPVFRKVIDREKKLIYERKDTEILV
jgi:predicted nucleotidyltransferase